MLVLSVALSGCSLIGPNKVYDHAHDVVVANQRPQPDCHYRAEVYGNQGNWFTGLFTSRLDLLQGAYNQLRNNASVKSANYVYLEGTRVVGRLGIFKFLRLLVAPALVYEAISIVVPFLIFNGATSVSVVGTAYQCPGGMR